MEDKNDKSLIKSLKTGTHLNLNLQHGGKVKIERRLPFLLIFRNTDPEDKKTVKLVLGESSYLVTTGTEYDIDEVRQKVKVISKTLSEVFGAIMIMEIWIGEPDSDTFLIKASKSQAPATIQTLTEGLRTFCHHIGLKVKTKVSKKRYPLKLKPILSIEDCQECGVYLVGLEIPPFFRDFAADEFYFVVFRDFKTAFSQILRKTIFEFIRVQTNFKIENYNVLGSTKINDFVWEIDKQLYEIQTNFQFLLLISPKNILEAKEEFKANNYRGNPKFLYRLLPIDPDQLKEALFRINILSIEDPTLAYIFLEKREEVEKQITMLKERGTENFLFSSIRLYSSVDKPLYETAKHLLKEIPAEEHFEGRWIDSHEMARRCREEIEYYKQYHPGLDAKVEVKKDIVGMLVSKGQLYIGESYAIPENRVEALIHHEVGTHVLTFYNGMVQPFQQLSIGLADYDELQEGIAVLAEYLVGGLTRDRIRLLAARVVAGRHLTSGNNFEETFHELTSNFGIDFETAFQISTRIHQSGGCTKDIIYLRGLINLIDYLQSGGDLEPLFVGKIALKHVPLINELRMRKILKPTPLYPRYLKSAMAKERLQKIKDGLTLLEMLD